MEIVTVKEAYPQSGFVELEEYGEIDHCTKLAYPESAFESILQDSDLEREFVGIFK